MKNILITLILLLCLCGAAEAQHSITAGYGFQPNPSELGTSDGVWSGVFAFDLGWPKHEKLGHFDLTISVDSIPLIGANLQWVYEHPGADAGIFVSLGAGWIPESTQFDTGTNDFLFRISAGMVADWFTLGWTHWSHGSIEGKYNPGVDTFWIGLRFTYD